MQVRIDYYEYRERGGVNIHIEGEFTSDEDLDRFLEAIRGPRAEKPEHIVETRT